jgi:hypothetical protein
MLPRLRRRRGESPLLELQTESSEPAARLVVVTYMTSAGLGACRLRDPRWCYRGGRLALVGEHVREYGGEIEIGFDFDQILTLETALA